MTGHEIMTFAETRPKAFAPRPRAKVAKYILIKKVFSITRHFISCSFKCNFFKHFEVILQKLRETVTSVWTVAHD